MDKIIIGTAQFGLDYGINNKSGKIPAGEVFKILDKAVENRIDFVDTAQAYGTSEAVIGNYLREKNSRINIISKILECEPDEYQAKLSESLERLNLNRLYGLLLHSFDNYLKNPAVFDRMMALKELGSVGKVGFSLYYPNQLSKLIEDNVRFDLVQIPYSLFDRRFEENFKMLKERNVEIHVRSVFLQGLFFMPAEQLPPALKEFVPYLDLLKEHARALSLTINELALLFVLTDPMIDKAVIGIDNMGHMMDIINVCAAEEKIKLVNDNRNTLADLAVKNEKILIPSNWN